MSKVLVDRELLERLQEKLDPHRDAVLWGDVCDALRRAQPAEAEGVSSARLMNTLAELARRAPLRTLHTICETQRQVSTVKLERYLEPVGDTLADYAFTLRIYFDKLSATLSAVTAERDRLQAALSAPDTITAEPAGDYDNLRKQFQSLRMLANSNAKMVHHWRAQCGRETRETLLASAASVNAERDTNSMLTDALETAERERDRLRAEVEGMRKAFMRMRNVAAGYSNYCEFDSANTRRLEREFEAADELFRSSAAMAEKEA